MAVFTLSQEALWSSITGQKFSYEPSLEGDFLKRNIDSRQSFNQKVT